MEKTNSTILEKDMTPYAYCMTSTSAKAYLKKRSEGEKKINNQSYLCMVVNNEFGLKGNCVRVIID